MADRARGILDPAPGLRPALGAGGDRLDDPGHAGGAGTHLAAPGVRGGAPRPPPGELGGGVHRQPGAIPDRPRRPGRPASRLPAGDHRAGRHPTPRAGARARDSVHPLRAGAALPGDRAVRPPDPALLRARRPGRLRPGAAPALGRLPPGMECDPAGGLDAHRVAVRRIRRPRAPDRPDPSTASIRPRPPGCPGGARRSPGPCRPPSRPRWWRGPRTARAAWPRRGCSWPCG